MISERDICELFSARLPSGRLNECFEADAEVIRLNGADYLFTTDEFSAEDSFPETDPRLLGWNIAVGAISDIFACGGVPLYYAHALTVNDAWDTAYLERFADGVEAVLRAIGAGFIGGDCGRSELWRCTVSVIGACPAKPVLRRGAAPGDALYLSGLVGAGNLLAGRQLVAQRRSVTGRGVGALAGAEAGLLALRQRESILLRQYASAAIDTSDGVWNALNTLADLNGTGYAVAGLPYLPAGLGFCQAASLPRRLLFLGECGEYELLLAVRPEREAAFLAAAQQTGCLFHRLGRMTAAGRTLGEDGETVDLGTTSLSARDFKTAEEYLAALLDKAREAPSGPGTGKNG